MKNTNLGLKVERFKLAMSYRALENMCIQKHVQLPKLLQK